MARLLRRDFLDTDVVIQTVKGRTLQSIVDKEGYLTLRSIEEEILLGLNCRGRVIATGGSAVYSDTAMAHLKKTGCAVFLDVQLSTLKARVRNYATRGLAKRADQTLEDLFAERLALYTKYAPDLTVRCDDLTHDEVCNSIIKLLPAYSPPRL